MSIEDIVPRLVEAGLNGDRRAIESLAIKAIRMLRPKHQSVATAIADTLAERTKGSLPTRASTTTQIDEPTQLRAIATRTADPRLIPPVLGGEELQQVNRVLQERRAVSELAAQGLLPTRSIILEGLPGVGKTYLAHYFASQLSLPLMTLDLAAALSSFLGQTGQNIKSALEFAHTTPVVLLLDEFDAIGQERRTTLDVGELRRVVSVLLQELESWPTTSLLVGATNHPDLIDEAMWRRFDMRIRLTMPDRPRREEIWSRAIGSLEAIPPNVIEALTLLTENWSPFDIAASGERIKKRTALEKVDASTTALEDVSKSGVDKYKRQIGEIVRLVWPVVRGHATQAQLGDWLHVGQSTVSHHLRGHSSD